MNESVLALDGRTLTLGALRNTVGSRPHATIPDSAMAAMRDSAAAVERAVEADRTCYGINTGFGAFANQRISKAQLTELQYNLVRSHACGIGEPLDDEIVRRIVLLKANSLAVGISGVRPAVVEALAALFNAHILPVIPRKGSVAASGDLAPLAHLALALIGEGEAKGPDGLLTGKTVMQRVGLAPLRLAAKEGLALVNGTQVSAALAIEGLFRAENLLRTSVVAGALSVEALAGSYVPFDARIHAARRLLGQQRIAAQFRTLLTDSDIRRSHVDCDRVQDPYAVRCMPQVFGAVWDTLAHAAGQLEADLSSVSDNPLIFGDDVLSGGNFHAEPIAFISDFMTIATAELGSISERRTDLLERRVNPNLNMFLTDQPGLESGFMIAHVATAALASENKTLAHPASVDSIPTSAGQEDHVSMATWGGLKLLAVCDNVAQILAIELLAASRALDRQRPLLSTPELEVPHEAIRAAAPFDSGDHRLDRDIRAVADLVSSGRIAACLPAPDEIALY